MATLVLLGIIAFALFNLIRETSSTHFNVLSIPSPALYGGLQMSPQPVWNVLITQLNSVPATSCTALKSAVRVLPMPIVAKDPWDTPVFICSSSNSTAIACDDIHHNGIVFSCELVLTDGSAQPFAISPVDFPPKTPNLLVTVNFTTLGIDPNLSADILGNSVQVRLGLVEDLDLIVQTTQPVILLPGSNLVGIATVRAVQQVQSSFLSTFGPDVGTVRISLTDLSTDWLLIQEQRDSTVLKAFSAVGGLWTFIGGIFIWLFGSLLLRVLRGTKPFTVFGLVHNLQHEEMRKVYLAQYRQVITNIRTNNGILAILYDHLIDLDFLVGDESTESTPLSADDAEDLDTDSYQLPSLAQRDNAVTQLADSRTEFNPY